MMKSKTEIDSSNEIKKCKKCGDPLSSKSKYKLCENCRRERAKLIKEICGPAIAFGITVISVVPGVKHFVKK